jgi:hypothetical protein
MRLMIPIIRADNTVVGHQPLELLAAVLTAAIRMVQQLLTPSLRKRAVTWAVRERGFSQRRACGLVGLHPKTSRYASTRPDDSALRTKLKELASQRRRLAIAVSACCWLARASG